MCSFSKLFEFIPRREYSSPERSSFHSRRAIQESEKSTRFYLKKKEREKIVREIVEIQPFRLFVFHEKIGTEFIYSILLEIFKIFRVSEILI